MDTTIMAVIMARCPGPDIGSKGNRTRISKDITKKAVNSQDASKRDSCRSSGVDTESFGLMRCCQVFLNMTVSIMPFDCEATLQFRPQSQRAVPPPPAQIWELRTNKPLPAIMPIQNPAKSESTHNFPDNRGKRR